MPCAAAAASSAGSMPMQPQRLEPWVRASLRCPYDRLPLADEAGALVCGGGHRHRVVDGVPILLREDVTHPHFVAEWSLHAAEDELLQPTGDEAIDPWVPRAISGTGGYMYMDLTERLTAYPIPELRTRPAPESRFLDIGCNWGRWSIAAARAGCRVVGVDPSLEGARAAVRVTRQLGLTASFVVGDARHLPFAPASFDITYSYSVLQHLSKDEVRASLDECARVLASGGRAIVQMPNGWGVRSLYHRLRRAGRIGSFDVRYWTVGELERTFERAIGPGSVTIDGFLSLNPQAAEAHLLSPRFQTIVALSERLRRLGDRFPLLRYVADSVYVEAIKPDR